MKRTALMTFLSALLLSPVYSAPDPDFYIYLCFGQSNMEGAAPPEAVDRDYVDPRFQTMACVNFQNPSRTMVAAFLPPLCVLASIYVKGKNM